MYTANASSVQLVRCQAVKQPLVCTNVLTRLRGHERILHTRKRGFSLTISPNDGLGRPNITVIGAPAEKLPMPFPAALNLLTRRTGCSIDINNQPAFLSQS